MITMLCKVAIAAFILAPGLALAHGGGLNAEGCHHDRKNGGYHCHRAPAPRSPESSNLAPNRLDTAPARQADRTLYYPNCAAARAAGAAPVTRGDPGYASHLDRDNDGVGCE